MVKLSFLAKLRKKKILELVEPSEEVKLAYIKKSESNMASARILLNNSKLEESVVLAYYSMYNLVMALFFKVGIKSENHSASIRLLKETFGIDNSEIAFAKKERLDKQYYVNFRVNKEEVIESIRIAEAFNRIIADFISKLTNETITNARRQFNTLTEK